MLEAGHDLIFSSDERKTKDFCAQRAHFLIIKRKLEFCRKLNWLSCYFMVLWYTYYTYLFDFLISEFEFFVQCAGAVYILGACLNTWWKQLPSIFLTLSFNRFIPLSPILKWYLVGIQTIPGYSHWILNVCWPIKKVCWPTRNQLLCFCSLSGWMLQILTMLFANWLPQIYHAQPFLATFKGNAPI